jgi:hypothetical protein
MHALRHNCRQVIFFKLGTLIYYSIFCYFNLLLSQNYAYETLQYSTVNYALFHFNFLNEI